MRSVLSQCGWLCVATTALASGPAAPPTIVQNHLASNAPSGVNVFLACSPAAGASTATAQLCWGGERGLFSRSFRLTSLSATDAAGKPVAIKAMLGDANLAAWRDAASEAAPIGDTTAYSVPLSVDPPAASAAIAKIQGTIELKLGKTVVRVPPESREKNQPAQSSLLEAKGLRLTELGEQQRFNLQFAFAYEKKGAPPTLFLVDSAGKPFFTSKPRVDNMSVVKLTANDAVPPDAKIRIGVGSDKSKLIPDAVKLFQSKEQLAAALAKFSMRVNEYACRVVNVFSVEVTRASAANVVPELVLDFAGKRIKGQGTPIASQQDPSQSLTSVWSFEVPADLAGKRPDVLVLLPGDDGVRSVPFEFHDPFAAAKAP